MLRAIPAEHSLTLGLPSSVALFFSRSSAWRPMSEEEREDAGLDPEGPDPAVLLSYAPEALGLRDPLQAVGLVGPVIEIIVSRVEPTRDAVFGLQRMNAQPHAQQAELGR